MVNIYSDNKIDPKALQDLFFKTFPSARIFHWKKEDKESLGEFDINNPKHFFFAIEFDPSKIEFGHCIELYPPQRGHESERALYLGQFIAKEFKQRILVPFELPEQPGNPYYDIIFEEGNTYLANDQNSNFADNTLQPVKILKNYHLQEFLFDDCGRLISKPLND